MVHRMMLGLVVAWLAATPAGAQIDLSNRKATLAPLATVSFSPYDAGGMLGSHQILADLSLVSFGRVDRSYGTVVLDQNSGVWLQTHVPIPNGLYSVQFSIVAASQPVTLTLTGGEGFKAQCSLRQVAFAPGAAGQVCDSGPFQVSDGKLSLAFRVEQQMQLRLGRITVNALRSPTQTLR